MLCVRGVEASSGSPTASKVCGVWEYVFVVIKQVVWVMVVLDGKFVRWGVGPSDECMQVEVFWGQGV